MKKIKTVPCKFNVDALFKEYLKENLENPPAPNSVPYLVLRHAFQGGIILGVLTVSAGAGEFVGVGPGFKDDLH